MLMLQNHYIHLLLHWFLCVLSVPVLVVGALPVGLGKKKEILQIYSRAFFIMLDRLGYFFRLVGSFYSIVAASWFAISLLSSVIIFVVNASAEIKEQNAENHSTRKKKNNVGNLRTRKSKSRRSECSRFTTQCYLYLPWTNFSFR